MSKPTTRAAVVRSFVLAVPLLLAGALVAGSERDDPVFRVGAFSEAAAGGALPEGWEPLSFRRVPRGTDYRLVELDGAVVVEADSRSAASGLRRRVDLDPDARPWLEWRWRIENVLEKGDVRTKQGDDYPARVYVAFAFDPERATMMERIQHRALRMLYGEPPPKAVINYIWASHSPVGTTVPNPYSDRATMVVVETGARHLGVWRSQRRNVARDYERIFGEPAPRISGVALMSDTDDTGESARAWFGDIAFRREPSDRREPW